MKMVPGPVIHLLDVLNAIEGVREAVGSASFEEFCGSRPMRRAVERELEIISEASRHIPENLKTEEPSIPWREIAGIGNVLRHDYQVISNTVVWNVLQIHLPPLEAVIW